MTVCGCGLLRLYYYEPNSSHFATILEERVDKVDAMDRVDWITCGVWRPRAALHDVLWLRLAAAVAHDYRFNLFAQPWSYLHHELRCAECLTILLQCAGW